jgi:hypothetical protein
MAAPIRPASAVAYGNEKTAFVLTFTNYLAPTAAEVIAASALDISCTLFDSFTRPTQNTNQVTKAARSCDTILYQTIGNTTYTGGELRYQINPQATAATGPKLTWEKLGGAAGGVSGFVVSRLAVPVNTDFAAGQFVTVWPVLLGPGLITTEGDAESKEAAVTQTYAITGPPAPLVALV